MLSVKQVEDIVDVYNVTTTLENYPGFENFLFNKNVRDDETLFFINFKNSSYTYLTEYINIHVFPKEIMIRINLNDSTTMSYLKKKYTSIGTSNYFAAFNVKSEQQLEEFVNKDLDLIIESVLNDD